jgi:hypothetical protein
MEKPLRTLLTSRPKSGFALVIALMLMAFVLLLMLSLSSLITVESKNASQGMIQDNAQQNAILALHVAMGELQRYAGPDQRITSSASLLDSNPDTREIDDVDEPNWTGAWDSSGELLTWLVSGNEGLTPLDSDFNTPDTRPAETKKMYSDGSVQAPLKKIASGAYAYWISDEGVKAKVTLPDSSVSTNPLISAQMVDITRMSGLNWLANTANQKDDRKHVISIESLKILAQDTAEQNSIDAKRHDLTAHSYGVLADTAKGSLKQDLTLALYNNSQLPSGQIFGPDNGVASIEDPGGPTWQQLQSWVNISATGTLQARPQHDEQTGISPVITQFQYYVNARTDVHADQGTQDLYLDIYPAITLWNPYDRPLRISDGKIDVARRYWDYVWGDPSGTFRWHYIPFHGWYIWIIRNGSPTIRYTRDSDPMFPSLMTLSTGLHDGMHFSMGNVVLAPGESISFSPPSGKSAMTMNKTDYYPLEPGFHPDGSYYYQTDVSGSKAMSYTPTEPPLRFGIVASRSTQLCVRFRDGDNVLQELYNIGGIEEQAGATTDLLPLGSSDMTGSLGTKVIRNFTDWAVLDAAEDRSIQWLSHLNPRGASQGAIPYFFHLDKSTITNSHINNPSFYSSSTFKEDQQLGLNNVGNGFSVSSASINDTELFTSTLARDQLHSVGQLMHAPLYYSGANRSSGNLTNLAAAEEDAGERMFYGRYDNLIPAYAIGNSEADPTIPLSATSVDWRLSDYSDDWAKNFHRVIGKHYDYSYHLNQGLWDGYFFSTLPSATSRQPANPRLLARDATKSSSLSSRTAASEFLLDGAFNVNSTSEEAWRALLGAFYGEAKIDAEPASPFVRMHGSTGDLFDPAADDAEDKEAYHGYRALTQDQIINLAHQVVKQIKWRRLGRDRPFTSLADFINRDPDHDAPSAMGDPDAFRLRGALSAALRAADLIDQTEADALGIDSGTEATINTALQDNATKTDTSSALTTLTTQAMEGWRSEGLPGWMTQADLLARLGSVLTSRSDTFKIRVCGESRDPITNEVNGIAWGEAIVQRLPEFVDTNMDAADADIHSLNSKENETFGRRFVIVDFHWISES